MAGSGTCSCYPFSLKTGFALMLVLQGCTLLFFHQTSCQILYLPDQQLEQKDNGFETLSGLRQRYFSKGVASSKDISADTVRRQQHPPSSSNTRSVADSVSSSANEFRLFDVPTLTKDSSEGESWSSCVPFANYSRKVVNFSPKQFMEHGPGTMFQPAYQSMLEQATQSSSSKNVNFITEILVHANIYEVHPHRKRKEEYRHLKQPPIPDRNCTGIYFHIYKNGGTTVRDMGKKPRKYQYSYGVGTKDFMSPVLKAAADEQHDLLRKHQIKESSSSSGKPVPTHAVYSFLRDPVSRFVSSVNQVVRFYKNKWCDMDRCTLLPPCLTKHANNTPGLLECFLDLLETRDFFLDPHLMPQSFLLYGTIKDLDLSVELMDLKDLSPVLEGIYPTEKLRLSNTKHTAKAHTVLGFDLSGIGVLTPELIRRICYLYQVDMVLLRYTGLVDKSLCFDPTYEIRRPFRGSKVSKYTEAE